MNWDRLQHDDDAIQNDLSDGHYRRALETLVQTYQHAVVGFCHNMLGEAAQAEEVAQEVFLDAYRAMPRFRQQSSVRTWLFAIARKKCLQALRNRERRGRLTRDQQARIADQVHREPSPLPDDDPEAVTRRVRQGLNQLSHEERSFLTMRYDTDLSVADMARLLDISMATVRRRLARALTRLREVIDGEA